MKLNLEIEIDWIDEERGIDEIVKNEIISGITSRIESKISEQVTKKVNDMIDNRIVEIIDQKTSDVFTDFINRPVTLTDSYGTKMKVYDKIEDVIKERFDNFLTQKVDKSGNVSSSSYDTKWSRIEFVINKQLTDMADTFTKDAVKKVSEEIKTHIKDGLTTKLGAELMSVLKVNEMLKIESK